MLFVELVRPVDGPSRPRRPRSFLSGRAEAREPGARFTSTNEARRGKRFLKSRNSSCFTWIWDNSLMNSSCHCFEAHLRTRKMQWGMLSSSTSRGSISWRRRCSRQPWFVNIPPHAWRIGGWCVPVCWTRSRQQQARSRLLNQEMEDEWFFALYCFRCDSVFYLSHSWETGACQLQIFLSQAVKVLNKDMCFRSSSSPLSTMTSTSPVVSPARSFCVCCCSLAVRDVWCSVLVPMSKQHPVSEASKFDTLGPGRPTLWPAD